MNLTQALFEAKPFSASAMATLIGKPLTREELELNWVEDYDGIQRINFGSKYVGSFYPDTKRVRSHQMGLDLPAASAEAAAEVLVAYFLAT